MCELKPNFKRVNKRSMVGNKTFDFSVITFANGTKNVLVHKITDIQAASHRETFVGNYPKVSDAFKAAKIFPEIYRAIPCKKGDFCWELRSPSKSIGAAEYSGYCGTCAQEMAEQEMAA